MHHPSPLGERAVVTLMHQPPEVVWITDGDPLVRAIFMLAELQGLAPWVAHLLAHNHVLFP